MTEVHTAHTADLEVGTLRAARALLDAVFAGDLTDHDWERTETEDGGIFVLPVAVALDLSGALTCDWRDGEVW